MNLTPTTETFGGDFQGWQDSAHGQDAAISGTIAVTVGFTAATHYPTGTLASGTALGKITASGKYGRYDDTATDGRQTFVGFLLTPQKVVGAGDVIGPILTHGRVNNALLPIPVDAAGIADAAGRIHFL
jgi:hypothetical protein